MHAEGEKSHVAIELRRNQIGRLVSKGWVSTTIDSQPAMDEAQARMRHPKASPAVSCHVVRRSIRLVGRTVRRKRPIQIANRPTMQCPTKFVRDFSSKYKNLVEKLAVAS